MALKSPKPAKTTNAGNAGFMYKTPLGKYGFLYKIPPAIKIIALATFSVIMLRLPLIWTLICISIASLIAFLHKFSLKEQALDTRAALYYFIFLYILQFFTQARDFMPSRKLIEYALHLFLLFQISALLFRTTTNIALKDALESVETALRRFLRKPPFLRRFIGEEARFALIFALFLGFIPEIFTLWGEINTAHLARRGGRGLKKMKTLLPVLLSLSFYKAAEKARSLSARAGQEPP